MQILVNVVRPFIWLARSYAAMLKRRFVGDTVEGLLVPTRNGVFVVDPEDMAVGKALIRHGAYGQEEIDRICSLTSPDSTVLFVGSHIGSLAIPVSKRVRHVTAIEANPRTFRLLRWNVLLNECQNLTPVQMAASDTNESLEFVVSRVNSGGSKRMPRVKKFSYFYDHPNVVKVDAKRLDECLLDKFDLIVMDIEGSEYFALKGMQKILSTTSHLIVEFLPHHLKYVSGVSVSEFLTPITPHFDSLTIPSAGLSAESSQFEAVLTKLFESDKGDDGIVFSKASARLPLR